MRLRTFRVRIFFIVASLVVCAVLFFGYRSRAAANKIFGNMTYFTSCPYLAEKVTLVNGYRVVRNFRLHVSMWYEGHYVYGDFNHDGLRDAAVIIGESQGGSDDETRLAFLINNGTGLVHRQSTGFGRAEINSLKMHDGKVIVDMFVLQDGDCMAGPTHHVKSVIEYEEGRDWIEGERISARSVLDPLILILKDHSLTYTLQRWDDLMPAGQTGDLSLRSR